MTAYWIADATGAHALVEGDEQRDIWVHLRGWHLSGEPGPTDQVRVVNGDLFGCVPFAALADGWADLGWAPGPPPEPVDLTRDPAPIAPAVEPPKPKTKAAAAAKIKES
jgi:hypothetical protein